MPDSENFEAGDALLGLSPVPIAVKAFLLILNGLWGMGSVQHHWAANT